MGSYVALEPRCRVRSDSTPNLLTVEVPMDDPQEHIHQLLGISATAFIPADDVIRLIDEWEQRCAWVGQIVQPYQLIMSYLSEGMSH